MPGPTLVWFLWFAAGFGSATFHISTERSFSVSAFRVMVFDSSHPDELVQGQTFHQDSGTISFLLPGSYSARVGLNEHWRDLTFIVDPHANSDLRVRFERVKVNGTVRVSAAPVTASLNFRNTSAEVLDLSGAASPKGDQEIDSIRRDLSEGADRQQVASDETGSYEVSLWPEDSYSVVIRSYEPTRPGWATERLIVAKDGGRRDFDLKQVWLSVRIVDDTDGHSLPGGRLIWIDDAGAESVSADSEGRVAIESVHSGEYTFTAKAEGYEKSQTTFAVKEESEGEEQEIRLKRKGAERQFQVILADGSAAGGVSVRYAPDPVSLGQMGLLIRCDEGALCSAPSDLGEGSWFLLYRKGSGATIVRGDQILTGTPVVLNEAGGILEIHLRQGEMTPAPKTIYSVSVAIEGVPLSDYWLGNIDGASGGEGMFGLYTFNGRDAPFLVHGLPVGPVTVSISAMSTESASGVGDLHFPSRPASDPLTVNLPSEPITIPVH